MIVDRMTRAADAKMDFIHHDTKRTQVENIVVKCRIKARMENSTIV